MGCMGDFLQSKLRRQVPVWVSRLRDFGFRQKVDIKEFPIDHPDGTHYKSRCVDGAKLLEALSLSRHNWQTDMLTDVSARVPSGRSNTSRHSIRLIEGANGYGNQNDDP